MANVRDAQMRSTIRRAQGGTREIMKRRQQPLKTIKTVVTGPKKKMRAHASFHGKIPNPPSGYTFLPFGTAELAWRCKSLANEQGIQILYVTSSKKLDPRMISHHVNRVGYFFPTPILTRACVELDYTQWEGRYMKTAEVMALQTKAQTAAILRQYGLSTKGLALEPTDEGEAPETAEQVQSLFKELFPAMPAETMAEIIAHSWQPGTTRVGTNYTIPLAKRIQSATVAHVRHMYTDYDPLLAAFGNREEARAEVHKTILDKIIQWLGHQAEEEDVLENIVRDFIVVDSDEESDTDDDASDDTSDEERHGGDGTGSDSSVQFQHHVAGVIDNDIEETDEAATAWRRKLAERTAQAQALIAQRRQRAPYHVANQDPWFHQGQPLAHQRIASPPRVNVAYRDADVIVINGKQYRRDPNSIPSGQIHANGTAPVSYPLVERPVMLPQSGRLPYDNIRDMTTYDRPVRSIEAADHSNARNLGVPMAENVWPGLRQPAAAPLYKPPPPPAYVTSGPAAADTRTWFPDARDYNANTWSSSHTTTHPAVPYEQYQPEPIPPERPVARYLPPQHGAPAPIQPFEMRPTNPAWPSHSPRYRTG